MLDELDRKAKFYKEQTGFFFSLNSAGMAHHPHQNQQSYSNLIGEGGICLHFSLNIKDKYIAVTEWDNPPKIRGDNRFYFPDEEPKRLSDGEFYHFDTDESLLPKWRDENGLHLEIGDIAKKYLVELMEKITEKKNE